MKMRSFIAQNSAENARFNKNLPVEKFGEVTIFYAVFVYFIQ